MLSLFNKTFLFLCCFGLGLNVLSLSIPNEVMSSRPLLPGKIYSCCKNEPFKSRRDLPVVYCFLGAPKVVQRTWQSVSVLLDLDLDHYDLYQGADSAEVWKQFENRSPWVLNIVNFRRKHIKLNPFNSTCLGIKTSEDYTLRLQVSDVSYLRLGLFLLGLVLFFLSPSLANNSLFYYLTGIIIGMVASVLVLFYFILKLLPLKRPAMFGMMAGGSTIVLYLMQVFSEHIYVILYGYQEYVVGYLFLSALISFIVCYRFGPVTNPRSKNLIQWSLQVFSMIMIYLSSYFQEVTLAVNLVMLFFYNVPVFRWLFKFTLFSKRVLIGNKPKVRLLSEEEYRAQGVEETARALDGLRRYSRSPDCNPWQTVLRLRDPQRFARFTEGKSDLTKEEMLRFQEEERTRMESILTDDSDDSD